MHARDALFEEQQAPITLPACDHYCGSERLIRKSLALQQQLGPVFDVTCDCEDGAAIGTEAAHAKMVAGIIASDDNHFDRVAVRIHDPSHPHWHSDLELILPTAGRRVAHVMIPKVESAADVERVVQAIDTIAMRAGIGREIPVHVLVETHGALRDVFAIAEMPRVQSISFGLMDFVSGHNGAIPESAMRSPGQFDHALVRRAKVEIAAACLAFGKVPSHNVTTALDNPAQAADDARRAKHELGYTRMWSIHPSQIEPVVACFRPTHEEAQEAWEVLAAAHAADWAPVRHNGKLHDRASYRYWWQVLQRCKMSGVMPAQAADANWLA